MYLRGIQFPDVVNGSGARGFFGEGYKHNPLFKLFGLDYRGCGFVAKTTTLNYREGNLPLKGDYTPKELLPKCIVVKPLHCATLNAVGLSGPGAKKLLETGRWQQQAEPFFISFMAISTRAEDRLTELKRFIDTLSTYHFHFDAPFGLEINLSCPNTGHDLTALAAEAAEMRLIASRLLVPIGYKTNLNITPEQSAIMASGWDYTCQGNTTPWKDLADSIKLAVFGSLESPLAHLGGGGFSGPQRFPDLLAWLERAKEIDFPIPVYAGGGIMSWNQAKKVLETGPVGRTGLSLGTIGMYRPWEIQKIIRRTKIAIQLLERNR